MNLEARLKEATQDPILSELKGDEGLFAVTHRELIYVGPEGVQRAPLAEVRRVASAKGGRLRVAGKEATFIEASVAGFDVGELKLFFEGVKGYVAKARRGELAPPAEPEPEPEPEPAPPPPPPEPEEKTLEAIPTEESPPVVPEEEEAPPPPPAPAPAAEPERAPAPARTSPLRLPLKLLALLTWAYAGASVYLYPGLDPFWLGGLVLGGLGLGLVEWRVADL